MLAELILKLACRLLQAFNELSWLLISPEEPSVATAEKSMQDLCESKHKEPSI